MGAPDFVFRSACYFRAGLPPWLGRYSLDDGDRVLLSPGQIFNQTDIFLSVDGLRRSFQVLEMLRLLSLTTSLRAAGSSDLQSLPQYPCR
jgi:hypothetical protein